MTCGSLGLSVATIRMGGTIGWILAAWPFTFIFVNWDAVASMVGQHLLGLEPKGQY